MLSEKYINIILVIILAYSCSTNNPVEQEYINQDKIIVGKWTDLNKYTIEFFDDGRFRDTIKVELLNGNYEVVRLGNYYLTDSLLKLTEFEFENVEIRGEVDGFAFFSSNYKVHIVEDKLERRSIEKFQIINGNGNEFWGVWLSEGWKCSYSNYTTEGEIIRSGIYNRYFTFNRDSSEYKLRYESDLHESSPMEYNDLSFSSPNLEINLYGFRSLKYRVETKNGIMIWDPIDTAFFNTNDLIRIK